MKLDRPRVSFEICHLHHDHYQTMDPIDQRLKALRAKRKLLKAKLQRIRKLEAKTEKLQVKLAWFVMAPGTTNPAYSPI